MLMASLLMLQSFIPSCYQKKIARPGEACRKYYEVLVKRVYAYFLGLRWVYLINMCALRNDIDEIIGPLIIVLILFSF